jgi:hypothetical protein
MAVNVLRRTILFFTTTVVFRAAVFTGAATRAGAALGTTFLVTFPVAGAFFFKAFFAVGRFSAFFTGLFASFLAGAFGATVFRAAALWAAGFFRCFALGEGAFALDDFFFMTSSWRRLVQVFRRAWQGRI